jgi:hypothetical protein
MSISLSTTKSLIINALLFIDLTLRRQTSIIRELEMRFIGNNNNNKCITYIALLTVIDQKRFTELRIDTIFTLLISNIVTDEFIKY